MHGPRTDRPVRALNRLEWPPSKRVGLFRLQSDRKRTLVVIHTERAGVVRLISARLASANERKRYEESNV